MIKSNTLLNKTQLSNTTYVYRITNILTNKHYYGSRTTKVKQGNTLQEDLLSYQSSSRDKIFKADMKENSQNINLK